MSPLVLISLILSLTVTSTVATAANSWTRYAADPGQYNLGFARAHWATSINKMLVFYGNSHDSFGNNSIRAFDPLTNSWEYLWANGTLNGGLQNRDNYASFYIPRLDELWVWGGSGLENFSQPALRSGRFKVSERKWLATSTSDGGAFSGIVKNCCAFAADPAMAWSAALDMGIMFGGSAQGNAVDRQWIFEPNLSGPEPYQMVEFTGPRPPVRDQVMNNLVAVGSNFYLYGGSYQDGSAKWISRNDLWKFDGVTRTWSQLASGGPATHQTVVTYDSDNSALVIFGGQIFSGDWLATKELHIYSIATNTWSRQTSTMTGVQDWWRRQNHVGVYAPTVKRHLYTGGTFVTDAGTGMDLDQTWRSVLVDAYEYGNTSGGNTTVTADVTPPSTPVGLSASALSSNSVTLSWQPSTDNIGVVGYKVYRDGSEIMSVSATSSQDQSLSPATSYSFAVAAYDAAGNLSAKSAALPVTSSSSSQTTTVTTTTTTTTQTGVTSGAWIARPLPEYAKGPYPIWNGGKHLHLAVNPLNGRVYATGGDYPMPTGSDSYRNETWSLDPATETNWLLEYPYCGPAGDVQPDRPDESVWVWDSKRSVFWSLPGYWESNSNGLPCNVTGATQKWGVMKFDPNAKKWAMGPAHFSAGGSERGKFGIYDPVTDSIFIFRHGFNIDVLHLNTGTWEQFSVATSTDGKALYSGYFSSEGTAFDPIRRVIYVVEPYQGWLIEYSIDKKTATVVSQVPARPGDAGNAYDSNAHREDFTQLAWDTSNKILYYMRLTGYGEIPGIPPGGMGHDGFPTIYTYNPATNSWATTPTTSTDGKRIRGNTMVYHEAGNYLMIMGGLGVEDPQATDGVVAKPGSFFLYRYGLGQSVGSPPQAPTLLMVGS